MSDSVKKPVFRVNPSAYGGIFVMPAAAADSMLKLASGNQLKVLICVFRRCGECLSAEDISAFTGVPVGETEDALSFWEQKGFLVTGALASLPTDGGQAEPCTGERGSLAEAENGVRSAKAAPEEKTAPPSVNAESQSEKPHEKAVPEIITVKPKAVSYDVICKRAEESEEVRALFFEAQLKLGRTIGTGDQSSLLLLHDYYGLPVEVILALCEYARSNGKGSSMNYIYTMGVDWSRREIDTLEEADREFMRLQSINKNWEPFCKITGIQRKKPTPKQSEYLEVWIDRWHFSNEMLSCAFEEMSRHTSEMSFPYMNKILSEWHMNGIDTPEKAKERERRFNESKAMQKAENAKSPYGVKKSAGGEASAPASYDIEKAQQKAKASVPTLKKKEKR